MLLFLLFSVGEDHHGFRHVWWAIYGGPVCSQSLSQWSRGEPIVLTSLDDRAQFAHGVNFDELSAAEQKEFLSRYRVFSAIHVPTPDERQQALRLRANRDGLPIPAHRAAMFRCGILDSYFPG